MSKSIYTLDWLIKEYMGFFQQFGMKETKVREYFVEWSKDRPALVKDYLWHLFQLLLMESSKQCKSELKLHENQRKIYFKMLEFRSLIEKKRANDILQLWFYADIKTNILQSNYKKKVTIISGHCCPYCDQLNEKEFDPDDVLKNQYLGSSNCSREWGCNCTYAYRMLRDKNGEFVLYTKQSKNDN